MGTKAGRARFCLRIEIRKNRFHVRSQQTGYFHRGRLRAGVAAPHPYFQKGIRESAKSKRRESVRATPKRLRAFSPRLRGLCLFHMRPEANCKNLSRMITWFCVILK